MEFSQELLQNITPNNIYRYFKYRLHRDANANENEMNAIDAWCDSVKFWKKAISYFMPNNLIVWNEIGLVGNPT